jgi:hypothetical protein
LRGPAGTKYGHQGYKRILFLKLPIRYIMEYSQRQDMTTV